MILSGSVMSWFLLTMVYCEEEMVKDAFSKAGIVGKVGERAPENKLTVEFGAAKVDLGNSLTVADVAKAPTGLAWDADSNAFYTLLMTDPDAPKRENPSKAEWLHWCVVDIPGSALKSGVTLTDYAGSTPPKGSGFHRYVFLVYKQPGKLSGAEKMGKRNNFSTKDFVSKYKLQGPVAGNFFQTKQD